MKDRIKRNLMDLMRIPGLSGHEDRVRRSIQSHLQEIGVASDADRLGNLVAHFPGEGPSVMLFTHMDQLGFIVRRIEPDGLIRLERLGGVPERALAAQQVLICVGEGRDIPAIIATKSHHATGPDEKYTVTRYADLYVDTGMASAAEVEAAGIRIGSPVVYAPHATEMINDRVAGTSVDDRAGCAVLLEIARVLKTRTDGPPVHLAFTVQEEFNLRGAQPLAQKLMPDIAIQLDLMLATDTPDMAMRGDLTLGGGPGMSLYSFHGRGTLNGVIPHPAMVHLFETTAKAQSIPLQRSAQVGVLTDLSYVQLVGEGVASIDMGFPMRYSHSAREMCDLGDLVLLARLLEAALAGITPQFSLDRDDYT
ncbi:M20/M25/M40 family metallo-hydrolase [Roseobacter sp. YSTF-M11]|uniref:M20/M25/M40 family metallo-hydrolase n=1 Tax=Roseobacter insulae TaxID=2859783 RepID=A0A9X1FTT2_9RHOB|nr:M20/M25/M40 family metallo-hydrolase [Roseobacter insulae]MBW4707396.1 M20/M25/M40 family metallo-hydrolase [Roseobacter insulae]